MEKILSEKEDASELLALKSSHVSGVADEDLSCSIINLVGFVDTVSVSLTEIRRPQMLARVTSESFEMAA